MSYQYERDQFIARMTGEGLDLETCRALLRAATTLQRYAELACSSEAADRDRVECPRAWAERKYSTKPIAVAVKAFEKYPCLCDDYKGTHEKVTRISVQGDRISRRLAAGMPEGWALDEQGDPRGYVLRVIPPSYQERNQGKDRFNLDTIGVPAGPSRLRF